MTSPILEPKMSKIFVDDLVHLTRESSETYVNGLLYNSEALFTSEIADLEEGTSKKPERLPGRMEGDEIEK